MSSEWTNTCFGELIEINSNSYSTKENWEFVNYLDTGSITENNIDGFQLLFFGKDKIPSRAKRKVSNGDIVFSTVRPNQRHYGLLKDLPENTLVSTGFATIRAIENKAFTPFLYWYLTQDSVVEYLHGIGENSTSAYPSIKPSDIEVLNINLPPLPEQKAIAHILGTLDDKIELNRKMNETLEQMAQALFKSWFVDFDPVLDNAIAKGNSIPDALKHRLEQRKEVKSSGKYKALPKEIMELFPSSFEFNDELEKWIPEGWDVSTVGQEFNVTMGQSPPGSSYNEEELGMPFFQGKTDFGFRFPTNRIYCTEPKRTANKNDTLISVRAPVGNANLALSNCAIGRGLAALRHKSKSISFTYYSILELKEIFDVFEGEGTVFGSINQTDLKNISVIKSDPQILEQYEIIAKSYDQKIEINEQQIGSLTKQRDVLLPQLLSGKLRVGDYFNS